MKKEIQKQIWYDTIEELELAQSEIQKKAGVDGAERFLIILPCDDVLRLCRGFLVVDLLDEDFAENHRAPIYESREKCVEILHDTFESYNEVLNKFRDDENSKVWPGDDPRRLRHGFVVHPSREWHTININLLRKGFRN